MKEFILKNKIYILVILCILSCILVYFKMVENQTIICSNHMIEDLFQKENQVKIQFHKDKVKNVRMEETFSSKEKSILKIKKDFYKSQKYEIKEKKDRLLVSYNIEFSNTLDELIEELYKVGYTCK